jgi:hypothetical protein
MLTGRLSMQGEAKTKSVAVFPPEALVLAADSHLAGGIARVITFSLLYLLDQVCLTQFACLNSQFCSDLFDIIQFHGPSPFPHVLVE